MSKKRYAICGLSNRAITMYVLPLIQGEFAHYGEVVGILDIDQERVRAFNDLEGTQIAAYTPDEFSQMINETQPDRIVVASPDVTHADYILKALSHCREVLVEKPMVINCHQANSVIEAEKSSGGKVRVTFNLRYSPAHIQIKRLIKDGLLGRITNIEFIYNVDTYHGSSYFYRWNRDRTQSGGLSVTKGCHHFDLINWWLDDLPYQVFAYGALNYYGTQSPYNPSHKDGKKYSTEEQKKRCPYYNRWHEQSPRMAGNSFIVNERFGLPYNVQYPNDRQMYIYDEDIAIEDTYSAVVIYRSGASMVYSANFSAPWEGYILGINGTAGRIESVYYAAPNRCPFPTNGCQTITYYPLFGGRQVYAFKQGEDKHGGSDLFLKRDIFMGTLEESLDLGLTANSWAGAYAVAIGEAIWRSIEQNQPINICDLLNY